jgi:Ala-tRNA(Pro) deacylase
MKLVEFLTDHDVPFDELEHQETFSAQRMAHALHLPGREVAKTVLLRADRGYAYFVAVLPATKEIDLRRASIALGGSRLELAKEAEVAEHCPDCETGVLPPFGSQYAMRTLVDRSVLQQEEMVFESNTHDRAIRIKSQDFRRLEEPLVADIVRR